MVFAYVTKLRTEGKLMHIVNARSKDISDVGTETASWEMMFIVWTVYASLPATPPTLRPCLSHLTDIECTGYLRLLCSPQATSGYCAVYCRSGLASLVCGRKHICFERHRIKRSQPLWNPQAFKLER